jgi:hypothetical protein
MNAKVVFQYYTQIELERRIIVLPPKSVIVCRCHTNTTSNNYTTSDEDVVALMQQLRDQRKQRAVQQVTEALDQHQDDEEMRNNFTQQNSTSMSHVKQDYLDDETPTGDIIPASDVLTTHKRFQRVGVVCANASSLCECVYSLYSKIFFSKVHK